MSDDSCPNCVTGTLYRIPDSTTFYPESYCYQCDSCRLKVHPDNTGCNPEQFCEMFGHRVGWWNKWNPFSETVCSRCGGDP